MMNHWRLFLFSLLFISPVSQAELTSAQYLDQLLSRSRELHLSEDPYWRILLHYRHHWYTSSKSEIKAKDFFNSKEGPSDPEAELVATLHAFFEKKTKVQEQPLPCLFIDRYRWLEEKLHFDPKQFPPPVCQDYETWKNALDPSSVTLVFSSYYMNNPSSAFGHTLLRLNHRRSDGNEPLLDYGVNYAANPTTSNALLYGLMGLVGGFDGVFSNIPYFLKVSEYNDIESRELWEYTLNFTQAEIDRMMLHLWTVGHFTTPYYFFDENCSYMLLTILDSGRPELQLGDENDQAWVIPADTVRALTKKPSLVSHVQVRPSLTDRIHLQLEQLTSKERELFFDWIHFKHPKGIESLGPSSARKIYDLALDYLRYLAPTDKKKLSPSYKKLQNETLEARAQIAEISPEINLPEHEVERNRPDLGHKTGRITLGQGHQEALGNFTEFGFRPAFQDLNAATQGYPKGVQIDILDVDAHYNWQAKNLRLERFSLANIVSLEPYDSLFKKFSWSVRAGADPIRDFSCGDCTEYRLNAGYGYSVRLVDPLLVYLLAKADFGASPNFAPGYRLGPAGDTGALLSLGDRMSLLGSVQYRDPLVGHLGSFFDKSAEFRYSISTNTDFRLSYEKYPTTQQEKVLLNVYF